MAEISIKELSNDIRQAIADLKTSPDIESVGIVTRLGDGIASRFNGGICATIRRNGHRLRNSGLNG